MLGGLIISYRTVRNIKAGIYKDIYFEVVNWYSISNSDKVVWNFYIYIPKDILNKKEKAIFKRAEKVVKVPFFRYYKYEILNDLFDMHGGITYLSIEFFPRKVYKVGCDYNHLYDNETDWDFDIIYEDVKYSIDTFLKNKCLREDLGYE